MSICGSCKTHLGFLDSKTKLSNGVVCNMCIEDLGLNKLNDDNRAKALEYLKTIPTRTIKKCFYADNDKKWEKLRFEVHQAIGLEKSNESESQITNEASLASNDPVPTSDNIRYSEAEKINLTNNMRIGLIISVFFVAVFLFALIRSCGNNDVPMPIVVETTPTPTPTPAPEPEPDEPENEPEQINEIEQEDEAEEVDEFTTLINDYTVELDENVFGTLHGWSYHFPDGSGTGFDIIFFIVTVSNLSSSRFSINSAIDFRLFLENEEEGLFFVGTTAMRDLRLNTQIEPNESFTGIVEFWVNSGDEINHLAYGTTNPDTDEFEITSIWNVNFVVPEFD